MLRFHWPKSLPAAGGIFAAILLAWLFLSSLPVMAGEPGPNPASPPSNPQAVSASNRVYFPYINHNFPHWDPWGIEITSNIVPGSALASQLEELKPSWVRLHNRISWRRLQPQEGAPIDWSALQKFEADLRYLKSLNIQPEVVIYDFPRWATSRPVNCSAIREDKYEAFKAFLRQVVTRYSAPEFNVHNWEIGNEVDVDPIVFYDPSKGEYQDRPYGCWGDESDYYYGGIAYGEMIQAVVPAIKAVDPHAKIWNGGLLLALPLSKPSPNQAGRQELFLKGILEAGAGPYLDVIAYHGHAYNYSYQVKDSDILEKSAWAPWGGGYRGKGRFLSELMAQYNINKPLVINEMGYGCPNSPGDLAKDYFAHCASPDERFFNTQAMHLARVFVRSVGEVSGFAWYTLNPPGWRWMSLLDTQYNPRPAFNAYKTMINILRGFEPMGPVDYGFGNLTVCDASTPPQCTSTPAVEAYEFRQARKKWHVVWSYKDETNVLTIPQARFKQALDLYGNPVQPISNGSDMLLQVGFSPIYIQLNY